MTKVGSQGTSKGEKRMERNPIGLGRPKKVSVSSGLPTAMTTTEGNGVIRRRTTEGEDGVRDQRQKLTTPS